MVTRIVMDESVETPSKIFIAGQVYDSRFPLDIPPASDGVQHSIEQHRLDFFIAQGWAHEESSDEWWMRIEFRRKGMLADPATSEETKQLIRQQDAIAAPIKAIFRPQPTRGSAPTNPATLAATGDL